MADSRTRKQRGRAQQPTEREPAPAPTASDAPGSSHAPPSPDDEETEETLGRVEPFFSLEQQAVGDGGVDPDFAPLVAESTGDLDAITPDGELRDLGSGWSNTPEETPAVIDTIAAVAGLEDLPPAPRSPTTSEDVESSSIVFDFDPDATPMAMDSDTDPSLPAPPPPPPPLSAFDLARDAAEEGPASDREDATPLSDLGSAWQDEPTPVSVPAVDAPAAPLGPPSSEDLQVADAPRTAPSLDDLRADDALTAAHEQTPSLDSASYDDDEPSSYDEDSADMGFLVVEDSRDFPDLHPDNLPDLPGEEPPPVPRDGDVDALGAGAVRRGMEELRAGNREDAIAWFEHALRDDPDDAMAQGYLSLAQGLLIRDILPGVDQRSVPRLRVGHEVLMTLDLDAQLGRVLSIVDGTMTLDELEAMIPELDRSSLYRHLAAALEGGLIEFG